MRILAKLTGATPSSLYEAIYRDIRNGHIQTWVANKDNDLSHTGENNRFLWKGFMRPMTAADGTATFELLPPSSNVFEHGIQGIFMGRFAEMLINHYGNNIAWMTMT